MGFEIKWGEIEAEKTTIKPQEVQKETAPEGMKVMAFTHFQGKRIAQNTRRIRNSLSLTASEFADSTGVPLKLILKLESGVATKENLSAVLKWLHPLGYSGDEFFK